MEKTTLLNVTNVMFQDVTRVTPSASSTTSSSIQMSSIYNIIGVIGVIGNMGVIVVLSCTPALRKKYTNIFILNQSCLDFTVCVMLIATAEMTSDVPYTGVAGDLYCKLWQTKLFLWAFMLSSTYNLLALSAERYLEVCHPIWHKTYSSRNKILMVMCTLWLSGVAYQCMAFIPTSYVKDGMCQLYARWPSKEARRFYGISVVAIRYLIPLIVLSCAYGRIARTLHLKMKQKHNPGQPKGNNKWQIGKRNTIRTLFIMAASYILCWSINQIYYFMFNVGFAADFTSDLYHSSVALVFLSSIMNPLIYVLSYRRFTQATVALLRGRSNAVGPHEAGSNTQGTTG